jgi:hypothetical protein
MSGRGMTILRMVARAWSAVSALVLALFFVEHLEWFADLHHLPPGRIFAAEGFHLLLILGLVAAWKWEVPGAMLAAVAAVGFTLAAEGGWRFVSVMVLLAGPAALFLIAAWWKSREERAA